MLVRGRLGRELNCGGRVWEGRRGDRLDAVLVRRLGGATAHGAPGGHGRRLGTLSQRLCRAFGNAQYLAQLGRGC